MWTSLYSQFRKLWATFFILYPPGWPLSLCMFAKDRDDGRPPLSISAKVIWLVVKSRLRPVWLFQQFSCSMTKPHAEVSCLQTVRTVKTAALCWETLTHRCEPVWSNVILRVCSECTTTPHPQTLSHPAQLFTVYCALISKSAISQTNILD